MKGLWFLYETLLFANKSFEVQILFSVKCFLLVHMIVIVRLDADVFLNTFHHL